MVIALQCRYLVRDSSSKQDELDMFLQTIAGEGTAVASPSEASSPASSTSLFAARDVQNSSASPTGSATELCHRQESQATTDPALPEVLQHMGCCGLPDSIGSAPWQELADTGQPSSAVIAESSVLLGLHEHAENRATEDNACTMDSEDPECSTSRAAEPPGCKSGGVELSEVKQEQVKQA